MRALLYRQPSPSDLGLLGNGGSVVGFTNLFGQPSSGFADRVALFTSSGANLAIAVLLIVALIVIAMTPDASEASGWLAARQRFTLMATGVIASVVVVANLVMCFEVLDNATGVIIADDASNKASSIVRLLAPVVLSAAVVLYASARLRSSGLSDSDAESDDI
jgi:TctA family transporter